MIARGRWMSLVMLLAIALLGARSLAGRDASARVRPDDVTFTGREINLILSHRLPDPPPDPTNRWADDPRAAQFGQYLFFERRFSLNGSMSCATCHIPEKAFTDGKALGRGLRRLDRNTPSLLNAAYRRWQFWDGRSDTLWMQALEPFEHAREYGGDRTAIVRAVAEDAAMRQAYEALFGELPEVDDRTRFPDRARPVADDEQHPAHQAWLGMREADREAINRAFTNLGKAIAAYERRLVVKNSPFDQFAAALAEGRSAEAKRALGESAQRGLKLFLGRANCRTCHFGPNFSDEEFHNNGVPPLPGGPPMDAGRYTGLEKLAGHPFNASGPFSDAPEGETARRTLQLRRNSESWGQMKTPSLRNVAETGPYMHAGQFETLETVVRFYNTLEGQVQAGHHRETILRPLNLTEQEVHDLIAFLESLSGRVVDASLLRQPESPVGRAEGRLSED